MVALPDRGPDAVAGMAVRTRTASNERPTPATSALRTSSPHALSQDCGRAADLGQPYDDRAMYEQIAANKRKAVFYVFLFIVIWLGIGAAIGAIFYPAHVDRFGNAVPANPGAIVAGMVIAGLF